MSQDRKYSGGTEATAEKKGSLSLLDALATIGLAGAGTLVTILLLAGYVA